MVRHCERTPVYVPRGGTPGDRGSPRPTRVCPAVPAFRLACLAYFCTAVPSSALGLLWPSIRLTLHEPVATLGILLIFSVSASAAASAATGRLLSRLAVGP